MKILTNYNLLTNSPVFLSKNSNKVVQEPVQKKTTTKAVVGTALAVGAAVVAGIAYSRTRVPMSYQEELAKSLSKDLGLKIKPSSLKSVLSKEEFLKEAALLCEENYVATENNIKKGIFRADLHSHSLFSDGAVSVEQLLNEAAEYGDYLSKTNGQKFLLALTDHDGVKGVKEALRIISQSPEKYKNVKFVPAAELSFPIICEQGSAKRNRYNNPIEVSEFLIYGINPFSPTTEKFLGDLYKRRELGLAKALEIANKELQGFGFSQTEYRRFFTSAQNEFCMLNQHWTIFNYLNIKARITKTANQSQRNSEELFNEAMRYIVENKLPKTPKSLDEFFRTKGINSNVEHYYQDVWKVMPQISPKIENGKIVNTTENLYEDIVEYALQENAALAFAHPGFTSQNYYWDNIAAKMKELVEKSKGTIKCTEKYHQAYSASKEITEAEIKRCNEVLDEMKLINIGGRDNHFSEFLKLK